MSRAALSALIIVGLGACKTPEKSGNEATSSTKLRWLNSWTPQAEKDWYATTQGSEIILWSFFRALETAKGETLFSSRENLSKYGFTYATPEGTESLPLGFVTDRSITNGRDYLGFNCAACHTSSIKYENKSYFIHGGGSANEMDRFITDLAAALNALKDQAKLQRFKARARNLGQPGDFEKIDEDIVAAQKWIETSKRNLVTTYPGGPGRLDAVSWILNAVTSTEPELPQNWHQPSVPINYPHLWTTPDLECVQTDCLVTEPLARNAGEVLGVFGHINLKGSAWLTPSLDLAASFLFKGKLFTSSVKVTNLYLLEESLRQLKAPKWPAEFPAIDQTLAQKGEALYKENCASCHVSLKNGLTAEVMTDDNPTKAKLIKVTKIPYREAGTDPTYMIDHGSKLSEPGVLGPILRLAETKEPTPKGRYPALTQLSLAIILATEKYFLSPEFKAFAKERYLGDKPSVAAEKTKQDIHNYRVLSDSYDGHSYKARPLDGIAMSAPFLHNGSVLSLADLLEAPEKRAAQFKLGANEYDVDKVGLKSAGHFVYDTRVRGNSNMGHLHGVELDPQSKLALLEFLKTL